MAGPARRKARTVTGPGSDSASRLAAVVALINFVMTAKYKGKGHALTKLHVPAL